MSLTRKIAEGTAVYTIGNFLNNFLGFLTAFFLIKALGKFEYGLLTLALSVFTISTIFLDLGSLVLIPSEIARYRKENPEIAKSIIREFAILQILLGVTISLVLFIISFLIKNNYSKEVTNLLWIVSFMVAIKAIDNIFSVTFYGFTKFKLHQGREILNGVAKCVLAFLVLYLGGGVLIAIAIYPISMLIAVMIFSPYFLNIIQSLPTSHEVKGIILRIYKAHGKFVVANVPLKKVRAEMPVWIIQYFLGVEMVAVFSVALKVISFLRGLLMPLNKVLFPVLSEVSARDRSRIHMVAMRGMKYTGILSFIISLISFILMPLFFKLAFKEYMEAVNLVRILLLVLLLSPLFVVVTPSLYALRGQRYIFSVLFYSLPFYVAVFSVLTYLFGLIGSALSWVLYTIFIAVLQYRFLIRLEPNMCISWREIFKIDEYDKKIIREIYDNIRRRLHGLYTNRDN